MKYLFIILALVTTSVKASELEMNAEYAAMTCAPRKPSKAYLEKMKRLKELEQEVVELRQKLKEEQDKSEQASNKVQPKEKKMERNSVSLLGLASTTKLGSSVTETTFKAKNDYEADLGLMYQRDFDSIRATLGATIKGTFMLGAGFRF